MRKKTILDYMDENANIRPDKLYAIENDRSISYNQIRESALNVANALRKKKSVDEKLPVVIFIDKGIDALVCMYGALYSGDFYVPMDIKTPADRLKSILHTLHIYILITSEAYLSTLEKIGYTGNALIYEDICRNIRTNEDNKALSAIRMKIVDTDLMYLIFTSGSTGIPKGVAIMHRSVMDYIAAFLDNIGMDESDICGNQAPFYADMSDREVFVTVAVGATICIIPQKFFMFPKKVLQYLDDCKVTFCAWVPTAYRIVMQFSGLEKIRPQYIKRLLFSGESMPVPVYKYWKSFYPDVEFIQSYGPTEITGSCTYYFVKKDYSDDEVIPIGKAFDNTGIILLDETGDIIPENSTDKMGEICVYGTCLAAGYYNNPQVTADAFVDLPHKIGYGQKMYKTGDLAKWNCDGDLVFISRKDYQVKHMGKRIELGEIENAMGAVSEITACCCVHNRQKDSLVLYYVGNISPKDIIAKIGNKLPAYMVPGTFIEVEMLPILPNGKTDRKKLNLMANEEEL